MNFFVKNVFSHPSLGSMMRSKISRKMATLTLDLIKHSIPTPARELARQTIADSGNLILPISTP